MTVSPKNHLWPDVWRLLALALVVRLATALPQQQPGYMDASYSYVNALNLAAGRGFVEDFVWNYLGRPAPPPHPSHLYWMPLTSILAWLGMAVGGVSYRAAQMPFVALSAGLALVGYGAALALGGRRRHGWLAGLLVIFSGFYMPYWPAIDNFAPFALFGSLALLLAGGRISESANQRISESTNPPRPRAKPPFGAAPLLLFAAGVCAALAHLARADGPLLLIAILLWLTFHVLRLKPRSVAGLRLFLPAVLALLAGYVLAMSPWFWRNWQVSGAILPAAGAQTIWLAGYDDLFSYGRELSARTLFAQGWGPVAQGRWWALTQNLQTVLAVWGMIFLLPLALLGGWKWRDHSLAQLAGLYGGLMLAAFTVALPFPGARGGLFHSGGALLPFIDALAALGLDAAVDWAAARRRHWRPAAAKRVFGPGLVVMAVALSGFIYTGRVLKNNAWNRADLGYIEVARWINQQDAAAVVMVNNPPAYRYHGGGLSVAVPNEPVAVLLTAARQYGVTYLVLEANHPAPLADLYQNPALDPRLALVHTLGSALIFEITWP